MDFDLDTLFPEPSRPPTPPPTASIYTRTSSSQELEITLVGNHPLWAHHLWNAARCFATHLESSKICENRTVLELGAGGALPSLIAVLTGAVKVVVTDYPDKPLLDNIQHNVAINIPSELQDKIAIHGYIWGQNTKPLLDFLPKENPTFDVIILSDLIFNHSQHDALLTTCEQTISNDPTAVAVVFYSHHRPHLARRDMEFFEKARGRGWITEKIVEEKYEPMFPEDSGDETVRSTVHGWKLQRYSAV